MMKKSNVYTAGYAKGQFDMLQKIVDKIILSDSLSSAFRSKKQYRNMLKAVLKELAEDSYKREKFMETGKITIQVDKNKGIHRVIWLQQDQFFH